MSGPALAASSLVAVPKIDLHLHLEGALPGSFVRSCPDGTTKHEALERLTPPGSWAEFSEAFDVLRELLNTEERFFQGTLAVLRELAEDGVIHAEPRVNIVDAVRRGLSGVACVEAIREAREVAWREHGISSALILGITRRRWREDLDPLLNIVRKAKDSVDGLDVLGHERHRSLAGYERIAREARRAGLPVLAHAGETAGADSLRMALDVLRPCRVGHATAAVDDPQVLEALQAGRVHVECSPPSNAATGACRLADHPLPRFLQAGLSVSLCSDDPAIAGGPLSEQCAVVAREFGLSTARLRNMTEEAARVALVDEDSRQELLARIHRGWPDTP